MEHSRKKLDLTGQRFGKLTVLEPAENIGSRTAWLCRCDCGQETVAKTQRLRNGRQTSCGCDKLPSDDSPGASGRATLHFLDGTCVEMIRKRTVRSNNTSGTPGVDWMTKKQRWRATICFKGKRKYLGSFEKLEDAVKARKRAEEEVFDAFLDACAGKIQPEPRDVEEVRPPGGHRKQRPESDGPAVRAAAGSGTGGGDRRHDRMSAPTRDGDRSADWTTAG